MAETKIRSDDILDDTLKNEDVNVNANIDDSKTFVSAKGINKTLEQAIEDEDIVNTSALYTEVVNARGSKVDLDARLDQSLNEDGTLKPSAAFGGAIDRNEIDMLRPSEQDTPNNTVKVRGGRYVKSDGTGYVEVLDGVADGVTFGPITTNPRIDLLALDDSGSAVIVPGSEGGPVPPYPADKTVIAEVAIDETGTVIINNADITDVRPFFNPGGLASHAIDGPAHTGILSDGQIPAGIMRDSEHAADPHTMTIDGRDVSVDGAKLDGIEPGATADQTAAEILTAIKTVDGDGSGLDADLLKGAAHKGVGGAEHPAATTSVAGFLSAADKTKLDESPKSIQQIRGVYYHGTIAPLPENVDGGLITDVTVQVEPTDTVVNVTSTTGWPDSGVFTIGGEFIKYTGKTDTSFTGCVRGYLGSAQLQDGTYGDSVAGCTQYFAVDNSHNNVLRHLPGAHVIPGIVTFQISPSDWSVAGGAECGGFRVRADRYIWARVYGYGVENSCWANVIVISIQL